MLEGLEAVEVKFSELQDDFSKLRLDAEYFRKNYLELLAAIKSKGFSKIGDFSFVTDGIHESISFCDESSINLISAKSPKNNFFDLSSNHYISADQHVKNTRTELLLDDVVVSTVGTIGNCAVVEHDMLPANSDRHVGIIRINDGVKPYYLSTFLLSKYGKFQTLRESTGNVQLNLFIYKIKELLVPNVSSVFQEKIESTCRLASTKRNDSQQTYSQAEEILLAEVGLKDFSPSNEPVNIKNFSESFQTSGRLDAEYYQKKYDDYINLVRAYKMGSQTISEACVQNGQNFNPDTKTEYRYIELSNIGKSGDINGCIVDLGEALPSRARRLVRKGDVIISSIEGSLDSCALITQEYDNALCSTGFYVLRSDKINSETLLVLFKSEPMQNLLKQSCSGTILTAINKDEFLNIPVPLIDKEKQQAIATLIEQSFALKKQSEHLLEVAKKAVEIAIEQNEETALQYISNNG